MVLRRLTSASKKIHILNGLVGENKIHVRSKITTPSGAILPEPKQTRFGFMRVISVVILGLSLGASMSKVMAHFLEKNNLFVPSDDDDDDDDD